VIVFKLVDAGSFEVLRVLHDAMDLPERFRDV
jgi:plasmid stabilization system protein ParE